MSRKLQYKKSILIYTFFTVELNFFIRAKKAENISNNK